MIAGPVMRPCLAVNSLARFLSSASRTPENALALADGMSLLKGKGYHMNSVWEQPVAWGENDSFRHLNNAHYARYAESGRIRFMEQMAMETIGPKAVKNMVSGIGIGLILKKITINFKRPVVYPDTLLIAQRPFDIHHMTFSTDTIFYSLAQNRPVTYAESLCVWYDYERLVKTHGPEEMRTWLKKAEYPNV